MTTEQKISHGKVATSEDEHEITNTGAFNRQNNRFITPFGNEEGQLTVAKGRYRLIWSQTCPWAHRAVIVRSLLGLEDVISLATVNSIRGENGWEFALDPDNLDPVLKIRYLPEIYAKTDPLYSGRATVPTIVDVEKQIVVNNDYHKLTNYLEVEFKPFHKENAPDLYPEHLRQQIDELNQIIFNDINNGVYKCGFAQSQAAYEDAYHKLFARLDEIEQRLATQRYLFGNNITDSDIRLYVTLARFDAAYYGQFKANRNRLVDFPNLWGYARDLYQTPGFTETTNFNEIKKGYYLGNHSTNQYQILPLGPDLSGWQQPHNRENLST